jgi:hypothetical protein
MYWLKRHPMAIRAHFRHSLVLTYAFPKERLAPLLPPGLTLDTYKDFGFLAIAMVQTEGLRPFFLPRSFGQDFFLTGYRIFSRFTTNSGQRLRGLKILRSDTNRGLMVFFGNLLTHYSYRKAEVLFSERNSLLDIRIQTPNAEADLHVIADLSGRPAPLPDGSPFENLQEARKFAGPLPFTFDYEPETHSIVAIEGVRENWNPQPIHVEIRQNTFLQHKPFDEAEPTLANAFHIADIPYMWRRGVRHALPKDMT